MNNYIDEKITIWRRHYFNEHADLENIVKIIDETGSVDDVIDESLGFVESDTLYDTSEFISPNENNNQATIEVYNTNQELIWNNVDKNNIN